MIKDFFMKRLLKSQMKGVPEAEQERIIALVEKNPELFQKIAAEMQEKMKGGMDQMSAAMEVMKGHEQEIKKVMQ